MPPPLLEWSEIKSRLYYKISDNRKQCLSDNDIVYHITLQTHLTLQVAFFNSLHNVHQKFVKCHDPYFFGFAILASFPGACQAPL